MKRIRRKINELISRPSKNLKKIHKSIVDFSESALHKRKMSPVRHFVRDPNFSLEAEAAQLAHRHGWEFPINHSNLTNTLPSSDIESDLHLVPDEEKESNVRDRVIEKLERAMGTEEKEGWDALYS